MKVFIVVCLNVFPYEGSAITSVDVYDNEEAALKNGKAYKAQSSLYNDYEIYERNVETEYKS